MFNIASVNKNVIKDFAKIISIYKPLKILCTTIIPEKQDIQIILEEIIEECLTQYNSAFKNMKMNR